ncbi:unnamed protein product [Aspergillus oryzae var. brunneus]|uniref:Unnamed protein product n=1 Tax=Aspergillus oryzae var. brunneus TaxID=332754 RepID=A0ABQ6L1S7_ASPOZ|nr:unnamed protein product [Aspergillus oryzae]GMG48787.1 unnamed protein product [Aspergillus oryzae var. brunneus]
MPTATDSTKDVVADESHRGIIIGLNLNSNELGQHLCGTRSLTNLAQLCSLGGWILYVYKACHGLGHHIQFLDDMQRMKLDEAAFWQVIICSAAGIALLKISIALNLLRFSPTRWYTMSLWTMTISIKLKNLVANQVTAFNIFTDVLFATIPIPIVWNLRMKRRVRMYLIGVFSLGYLLALPSNLHSEKGPSNRINSTVGLGIIKAVAQLAYSNETDIFLYAAELPRNPIGVWHANARSF